MKDKNKIRFNLNAWEDAFQPFAGHLIAARAYKLFNKNINLKATDILALQCALLNARCVGTLYRDRSGSSFVDNGGGNAIAHWIDVGDSESLTLCYDIKQHEFIISSLADLIERFNLEN